jgi:hypothetical protein
LHPTNGGHFIFRYEQRRSTHFSYFNVLLYLQKSLRSQLHLEAN